MSVNTYQPDHADGTNKLLDCVICWGNDRVNVPAVSLAPQFGAGEDQDQPVTFLPVCEGHAFGWYDDVPDHLRLPMIDIAAGEGGVVE